MVDKGRSFWRRAAAGIAFALIFTTDFHGSRAYASGIATTEQISTTNSKKKTNRHTRAKPKPPKSVPLDQLAPVPIELGEPDRNPLETYFLGLAKLESPLASAPEAPQPTPQPSGNPQSPAINPETPPPDASQPAAGVQSPPSPPQVETNPEPPTVEPPPVVRIIHFGDSHVASDYWAGVLREKLQARFGDAGPGFVLPGRPWPSIRYAEARSLDGQGWRTDGFKYTERDGIVGLGGMSLESYRELSPASAAASFSQFQIFAATSSGSSCFKVQVDDADVLNLGSQVEHVVPAAAPPAPDDRVPEPSPKSLGGGGAEPPAPLPPLARVKKTKKRRKSKPVPQGPPFTPWPTGSPLDFVELSNSMPLAFGPHQVSIRSSCGTQARLLGVELYTGHRGVVYDTDGVNGARLEDLEKALPALRTALLKQAQPTLIIVSYGTNDIGMRGFSSSEYEERAFQILTKLKQDAGNASILVTGPTDRGSPRRKTRTLIQAGQTALQPAIRKAALRAGCAYWDQQAAMGGSGAMTRWVRAGFGQYDYVHFTGSGYQKLANMLYDQLMVEYEKFNRTSTPQPPAPGTP
jgi:lysophospholipase L1-like esterase